MSKILEIHRTVHGGFLADLSMEDLNRLRAITRRVHQYYRPYERPLTDQQADALIDGLGPDAAERSLKYAVDKGLVS